MVATGDAGATRAAPTGGSSRHADGRLSRPAGLERLEGTGRRREGVGVTTLDQRQGESVTPVKLGGVRGGPPAPTLRRDRWWVPPVVTVTVLTLFVGYSSWAAFQNRYYYAGPAVGRNYLSPFYSPCITTNCAVKFGPIIGPWWTISPAIIILIFPLGFRLSCYYYRRAYYRSFWWAPPACAVADARPRYSGESRFPLIIQNIHRYFFYFALIFNVILTYDAIEAFRFPGHGIGMGLGTLIMCINAALLWLYSLSCHSCRHLCGGQLDTFATHPIRYAIWKRVSRLNKYHNRFAWASLVVVALTDLYIRLVASGTIHDPKFF
jgi:hypothetical protein